MLWLTGVHSVGWHGHSGLGRWCCPCLQLCSWTPGAAQLSPAQQQPTLKGSVTLKSTLSRTQQLPRSPVLSLIRCLVELVT